MKDQEIMWYLMIEGVGWFWLYAPKDERLALEAAYDKFSLDPECERYHVIPAKASDYYGIVWKERKINDSQAV